MIQASAQNLILLLLDMSKKRASIILGTVSLVALLNLCLEKFLLAELLLSFLATVCYKKLLFPWKVVFSQGAVLLYQFSRYIKRIMFYYRTTDHSCAQLSDISINLIELPSKDLNE